MASFSVIGTIESVKYLDDSCILYVTEYKKGYKKQSGEYVDDRYVQWRVIFKSYFKKYISEHFGNGMLVEVKGDILPFAVDRGEIVDGYSIQGQTCNLFCYPRRAIRQERKNIQDSQEASVEQPDLEEFRRPYFENI